MSSKEPALWSQDITNIVHERNFLTTNGSNSDVELQLTPNEKNPINNRKKKLNTAKCKYCGRMYNSKYLNSHIKKIHKLSVESIKGKSKLACLDCSKMCANRNKLINHLAEQHNKLMEKYTLEFDSYSDFLVWLENEEKLQTVKYIKAAGDVETTNGTVKRLYCNRDGLMRKYNETKERQRSLKSQGSRKCKSGCTSHIVINKLIFPDHKIIVQYYKTHYGHQHDIEHIPLHKSEKEELAYQLAIDESEKSVLKDDFEELESCEGQLNLETNEPVTNNMNLESLNQTIKYFQYESENIQNPELNLKPLNENKSEMESLEKSLNPGLAVIESSENEFLIKNSLDNHCYLYVKPQNDECYSSRFQCSKCNLCQLITTINSDSNPEIKSELEASEPSKRKRLVENLSNVITTKLDSYESLSPENQITVMQLLKAVEHIFDNASFSEQSQTILQEGREKKKKLVKNNIKQSTRNLQKKFFIKNMKATLKLKKETNRTLNEESEEIMPQKNEVQSEKYELWLDCLDIVNHEEIVS